MARLARRLVKKRRVVAQVQNCSGCIEAALQIVCPALLNRGSAIIGPVGALARPLGHPSKCRAAAPAVSFRSHCSSGLLERDGWSSANGSREAVRLEEGDPRARPPILRRYLQVAPGARPRIPMDRRAGFSPASTSGSGGLFKTKADHVGIQLRFGVYCRVTKQGWTERSRAAMAFSPASETPTISQW
jgi:hypothetical protein